MENRFIDRLLNSGSTLEAAIVLMVFAITYFLRKKILQLILSVKDNLSLSLKYESEKEKIRELKHHDIFRTIERVRIITNKHKFYHREGLDATSLQCLRILCHSN